ncbi:MAG: metal ABC transporter substrate-binding protein [Saccharofermentans sp.]|nr:metal ABC transporter substrate-binding protein [Saccharofermentans sp.]
MKKILAFMLAAFMAVCPVTGCSSAAGKASKDNKKMKIVTTIFPEYDWVMNVLGDKASNADVTMLLDKGVDLHSFKPSAEDIMKVSTCDLFIYVGGESDKWVDGVLKEAVNKDMVTINLMKVLGDSVKEEEVVEGMQEDHDHEHEHEGDHDEDHDHEDDHDHDEVEYDEHVWLSLRNASTIVKSISEAIQKIDAANSQAYQKNAETYTGKLRALDAEYKKAVDAASLKTILFGDRFPFRYMTDDYGLKYYAAFVGCSAETEASFETVVFLSKKADELSLPAVLTIEGQDHRIAKTIIENSKNKERKILTLDSMQATTMQDVKNGNTYLKIMESNLSVLKEALK